MEIGKGNEYVSSGDQPEQYQLPGFDTAVEFWKSWGNDPYSDAKIGFQPPHEVVADTLVRGGYDRAHAAHIAEVARDYTISIRNQGV